jgi:predicted kinase
MGSNLFVLHLSGPPCSGKTTLENALAVKLPGAYTVSFDRMKWQLAGYDRTKDGPLVDELVMGLFAVVCEKRISVLLDFSFANEEEYLACRKVAEENGHSFASVELTAPVEVLLERFHRRIEHSKKTGAKVTITDDAEFLETISKKFYTPPGTPKFDTSTGLIEKIVSEVLKSILPAA